MRIFWVSKAGPDDDELHALAQIHGEAAELVEVRDVPEDVAALRVILSRAADGGFVYAELPSVLAMMALDVGMEFGAMERRRGVLEGVYHVHAGTIDPVWFRFECEGCADADIVLLPGFPEDPLPDRWAQLDGAIERLLGSEDPS